MHESNRLMDIVFYGCHMRADVKNVPQATLCYLATLIKDHFSLFVFDWVRIVKQIPKYKDSKDLKITQFR